MVQIREAGAKDKRIMIPVCQKKQAELCVMSKFPKNTVLNYNIQLFYSNPCRNAKSNIDKYKDKLFGS